MTMKQFKAVKQQLKNFHGSTVDTAEYTDWSVRTVQRVKKATSFKQYKELCY